MACQLSAEGGLAETAAVTMAIDTNTTDLEVQMTDCRAAPRSLWRVCRSNDSCAARTAAHELRYPPHGVILVLADVNAGLAVQCDAEASARGTRPTTVQPDHAKAAHWTPLARPPTLP